MSAIFPTNIEKNKDLPIYLTSTGIYFDETSMKRTKGFYDYQILLTLEGIGQFETANDTFPLHPNSVVFIPANIAHSYHKTSDSWKTHWISYNGTQMHDFHRSIGLDRIYLLEDDTHDHRFKEQLETIHSLTASNYSSESLHISTCIYQLLYQLTTATEQHKSPLTSSKEDYLRPIVDYIDLHYMNDLTLDDLSGLVGITPQYLCKLFQNKLGLRPFEYIKQVRISKSKTLLIQEPHTAIADIALRVGFNHVSYYGALFKQQELKTPRQFRETYTRGD